MSAKFIRIIQEGDVFISQSGEFYIVIYTGCTSYTAPSTDYLTILVIPVVSVTETHEDTDVLIPVEICGKKVAARCDLIQSISKNELVGKKVDKLMKHEIKNIKEGIKIVMKL